MANAYSFTILNDDLNTLSYTGPLRVETSPGSGQYTVELVADRGLSRQVQHRVLTAKFGDGYEQRVRDGINTKNETFSISFNNRPVDEINLIAAFLDLKVALNFDFTVGLETLKVVCEGYNIVYLQDEIYSLQTNFRRVYEP